LLQNFILNSAATDEFLAECNLTCHRNPAGRAAFSAGHDHFSGA